MYIKRKYINDLLVYLQKNYGLYFVEFRFTQGEKQEIILCNPNNKDWWISIILSSYFRVFVTIAMASKNNVLKSTIKENLRNGLYKNYCKKYKVTWLSL